MDAITLLKNDHKTVETLFKKFEKLGEGEGRLKKQLVAQMIRELAIHAAIEEQILYPAARKAVQSAEDQVLESLEEHHVVKWTLSELEKLSVSDERYDAKVTVLMESVRHHVKEEEEELFPKLQRKMGMRALEQMGAALEAAKRVAPTHPHPRAPDTPPGNLVAGLGAGMLDKARDLVQGVARRGRAAAAGRGGRGGARVGQGGARATTKTATVARSVARTGKAQSPAKGGAAAAKGKKAAGGARKRATGRASARTGTRRAQ